MAELSDTQIRSNVRGILARHWIDLQRTSFVCARGVVRFGGRVSKRGQDDSRGLRPEQLESLELDLRRTPGVARTHFEFENWRRLESGQWVQVQRAARLASVTDLDDGEPLLEEEEPAAPGPLVVSDVPRDLSPAGRGSGALPGPGEALIHWSPGARAEPPQSE